MEFASLADRGARGGVEKGGFGMLSWTIPGPGARNANFMLMPTSPGVLLRRPRRPFRESVDIFFCPWSFEAAAAGPGAHSIGHKVGRAKKSCPVVTGGTAAGRAVALL